MKRLILLILSAVFLTSCSSASTVGEVFFPNDISFTEVEAPYEAPDEEEIPGAMMFIFNHLNDLDSVGIDTDYLEDYLNSVSFDEIETNVGGWIHSKYLEMCSDEGRIDQVYTLYMPCGRPVLSQNSPETFSGPAEAWNPYNITVSGKIYTPEWMFKHTVSDYSEAGITPAAVLEKIPLYSEFGFTSGAMKFFERKLSAFTGVNISLSGIGDEPRVSYLPPEPFSSDTEIPREFSEPFMEEYSYVPEALIKNTSVSADRITEWQENLKIKRAENDHYVIDMYENAYSFADAFGLVANKISQSLEEIYPDDVILSIANRNMAYFLEHTVNPETVTVDVKIFTAEWIYNHSTDEWEKEGISPSVLLEKLPVYRELPFTDEALKALEFKINWYAGSYRQSGK